MAPETPATEVPQSGGQGQELTLQEFCGWLDEIKLQPNWRRRANLEADYYDGNQLDAQTLRDMEDLGMAPLIENLIGPTIDGVLGMEVKSRLDWRVTASSDKQMTKVAEAMTAKMSEAEREAKADRANSEAYASQIKTGMGWVEVSRQSDPFKYPYRCQAVHRNEMFWDWNDTTHDLSEARYVIRRRKYNAKVVELAFPDKAELVRHASNNWMDFDPVLIGDEATGLAMAQNDERGFGLHDDDWRDSNRHTVTLYEVWFRRWVRGKVIKVQGGITTEFDEKNPAHIQAVARGVAQMYEAIYCKIRVAFFMGPHKLMDIPSPHKHGRFTYVPFFGKREDLTGVPYGLIRPMIPMQDEINARNAKMVWLLAAKRVTATKGVVKDRELARSEIARPDAWVELEQDVPPNAVFKVESDFALNTQQYQALKDKRESLKNVAGVYNTMLGKEGEAKSGVAMNTLVEQGTQTLADINDNARESRALVGDLLLSMIIEDIGNEPYPVQIGEGKELKTVLLNEPATAENGVQVLNNSVQAARLKVVLSDIPSTPSYRMQALMRLTEVVKSLPPQAQMLVVDFVVGAMDLPDGQDVVERLRAGLGLQAPGAEADPNALPKTPQQLQQVVSQAIEQALAEAGLKLKDREVAVKEADAETRRMAVEQQGEHKVLDLVARESFSQPSDTGEEEQYPINPPDAARR